VFVSLKGESKGGVGNSFSVTENWDKGVCPIAMPSQARSGQSVTGEEQD